MPPLSLEEPKSEEAICRVPFYQWCRGFAEEFLPGLSEQEKRWFLDLSVVIFDDNFQADEANKVRLDQLGVPPKLADLVCVWPPAVVMNDER